MSTDITAQAQADPAPPALLIFTAAKPEKEYITREGDRIPVGYLTPYPFKYGFFMGVRLDTNKPFHAYHHRLVAPGGSVPVYMHLPPCPACPS